MKTPGHFRTNEIQKLLPFQILGILVQTDEEGISKRPRHEGEKPMQFLVVKTQLTDLLNLQNLELLKFETRLASELCR